MANPILKITDGTDWVNLMAGKNGFNLSGWTPQVAGLKSGGVYAENIMTDNRQLVHAVFENVTETFGLVLHGDTQDRAIETAQSLRRLLQKAREFWTSSWQREPVWIEARAPNETNTRYALIHNWDTPSDNNPFTQPFFSCPGAIMDEFTLVIERGHWLSNPPGESTCVQISGSQDFREANAQVGGVQTGTFEPAAQLDCQYKAHDESSATCIVYGQYPHIEMGHSVGAPPVYLYDGSVRFPVTIPKNAHISSAVVKFIADDADAGSKEIHICALQENDAEQFFYDGSCDDWEDRSPYRTAEVSWTCGAIVHGTEYSTADISPVIQEMVDRSNWASGDAMMLLFENADDTASLKSFIGYGDAVHHDPQLYVEWTVPSDATYGQTETCTEDVVFVANKHNRANISHLYRYDASITTYSGNLIQGAEGLPYQLLPTTPAAGDCLYVGIDYYLGNSGPFCNVIFDIGTAATGVYGHWEYWNGAWTTLSVRDEMRNYLGAGFTATGVKGVFFNQMSDWGTININGVIAFWIRYYVDSVASPTHAHQQNRNPYTVVWPFVDIAEDEITGDLSALIKVNVHNRSDVSTDANLQLSAGRIMMALRSCDRGEDFTPYINLNSNWMYGQNQFGIWCLIQDIVNVTCPVTILSPTGRAFMYAPSDAASPTSLTLSFSVVFEGDRLTTYMGSYRAFLRCMSTHGSLTSVRAQLATRFGRGYPENYSEIVTLPLNSGRYTMADMGVLNIIPKTLQSTEEGAEFFIDVYLQNTDVNDVYVTFTDLILLPVDEWTGDFRFTNNLYLSSTYSNDPRLWVDSVDDLRSDLRVYGVNQFDQIITPLSKISNGPIVLHPLRHQRLWFLFDDTNEMYSGISNFAVCHSVNVKKNQRYFSMRGSG